MLCATWHTWGRAAVMATCGAGLLLAGLVGACAETGDGTAPRPADPPANPFPGSLTGQLLVAGERMGDPRFQETVIYMIEHDAGGALGLVVNRPVGEVPLAELLTSLGLDAEGAEGRILVHAGGPVEPGRGFILHSTDMMLEGSHPVSADVAVTAQAEMLRAVGRGEGPRHSLFVLGYAGWAPGQLESELRSDSWFVIPADFGLIFTDTPAQTWQRAVNLRGIDL